MAKKFYPDLAKTGQRLEFIPVNWRSALSLNADTVENITISQMRPLRSYINHCFVDILYYTSPIYRNDIMNSLSMELTRLFNLFCTKNPHFLQKGGQVSVLAHSLGTVIMYDILRSPDSRLNATKSFRSVSFFYFCVLFIGENNVSLISLWVVRLFTFLFEISL